MKWVCESVKPGVTRPCPLLRSRVPGPTSRAMSPLSPTAATRSPLTATAAAQGRALSPVHTRPYTTRSAGSPALEVALPPVPQAMRNKREAARAGRSVLSGMGISAKPGEPADGFELLQGAAAGGRRSHREEVPDVEQDLQHELVAHVGALEIDHPGLVAGRVGPVVGFPVDRFEVGEDAVAGGHGRRWLEFGERAGERGRAKDKLRLSPAAVPLHLPDMALSGRTVLFFAGPLYEDLELWYPKIRLEEEGAWTVVAGTGEKTYQGKRGYPLTVDTSVDEISSARFDGLVIPGGYAPDIMRRSPKLLQLTREIFEAGKPVAFICHAGWVPISAGIVRGKRGTSVGAIKDDLVNAGMLWEDTPVVVDGNLISSRTPADLPQFMRALIAALERRPPGD